MEEPVRGYRRKISVQAALPQLDEPGLTFVSPWLCPGGGRFEAAELDHICGVWDEEKEPTNAPRQWIRQPSQSGNDMRHHVEVHASHREQEWNHHHHHHAIGIQFLRSANKSLSHVHVHLLLLLLLSAFSWPGSSDPAPYSCHPHPPTPVTLSPVPPPYTPYSCHTIHYTGQRTPVILYPIQCSTSYTVDPKPQALDPTPLALDPTPLTLQILHP